MRVLIATVQVPFVRGGAEILAEGLLAALRQAGHEAEMVAIPFRYYPPGCVLDVLLACRLLDLSDIGGIRPDRVIGLKFPAYLIPHPDKVLWLVHQHRSAYDLWDHPLGDLIRSPRGREIRDAIRQADQSYIPQARGIYTIASNVSRRLRLFNGIDSTPLYHPPHGAERYYCAEPEDYFFFPSRLNPSKRQALVLQALAQTRYPVRVRFGGVPETPENLTQLQALAEQLRLSHRVEWTGRMSEDEKLRFYAEARAVLFPPLDEDYGYVTLEAMLAAKPVITCIDSGGPLEFVEHESTGLVAEPTAEALAEAMDRLWSEPTLAKQWGRAGRARYDAMDISWPKVVERLVA